MFLYTFIFLVLGFSYAAAQADSSRRDSVGRYEAETVVVERDRDKHLVTPLVLNVDLRETEQIAGSSSLSQVLPLLHSSFDVRSYGTLGGHSGGKLRYAHTNDSKATVPHSKGREAHVSRAM